MNKLLSYYQKELFFLKKHGEEFSKKYPKIARRLGYHHGISEDPHIERLTESFAFLTSKIHKRLDEDLPELMEALLLNLAPQFLYNYPSSCIIHVEPNPDSSGMTELLKTPSGTLIYSKHRDSTSCQFRTIYPISIIPATVSDAFLYYDNCTSLWKFNLELNFWDGVDFELNTIRFYLNGPASINGIIYALLCDHVESIVLKKNDSVLYGLTPNILGVGFEEQEVTFPRIGNVSHIHHLALDFFSFPDKFNFIDVNFNSKVKFVSRDSLNIVITLSNKTKRYEMGEVGKYISNKIFMINCTPAINLFEKKSEPIRLSDDKDEYHVNVDLYNRNEVQIWLVNNVILNRHEKDSIKSMQLRPLFGLRHSIDSDSNIFWHCSQYRTPVDSGDYKENMYIRLSDDGGSKSTIITGDILSVSAICTNGDIPSLMNNGAPDGDFDSDIPIANIRITALTRPSRMLPGMTLSGLNWRLISQLSLNYILLSGAEGVFALREMLTVYNYNNNPSISIFIGWIKDIDIIPVSSRLPGISPPVTARGINITVTLSKDADKHPDCFLFCSFLERFLGLHAPVNSFSRVITMIEKEEHTRKIWPLRSGKLSWL